MGRRFIAGQSGATAVEYALIVALIAVSSVVAWSLLGNNMSESMSVANAQMADGINPTQQVGGMGKN